jgi:hypothetical protein
MGVAVCVGKPKANLETRLSVWALPSTSGPGKLDVNTNGSQNRDSSRFTPDYITKRKD